MVVLTFKFDESYKNSRSFVVAGWIGEERHWKRLEGRWAKALAYENRTLPSDRQISRYHAAEMNANDGEFEGWENEGYRKLRFTKKLLKIVGRSRLSAIAIGLDLKSFLEIFPDREPSDFGLAYIMCIKDLMNEIGNTISSWPGKARVAVIHDHGSWDTLALTTFNSLVDNPAWPHRDRFVSITPLTWKQDVGLQAADLIAYELMRRLDDTLWTSRDMRKPLQEILAMNENVSGFYIDRKALSDFKAEVEATNEQEKGQAGGI